MIAESAQTLAPVLADTATQLRDALAQTETPPEMLQALLDANVAFASSGDVQSFAELRAQWQGLGPELAAVGEAMAAR